MARYLVAILIFSTLIFAQRKNEYKIKAVYLEKLTHFVEWPDSLLKGKFFKIGIVGEDPFKGLVEKSYRNHKILNKKVKVEHIDKVENLDYHILFISESEKPHLNKIIDKVKDKPILTIADTKGFAKEGVIINIITTKRGIEFVVNKSSEEQSGISISIRFMKYARVIE